MSIWSTLQTFLGHRDYERPDWIERLWVLIPYDDNAILRLWQGSDSDASSSLATPFLDKTFQLRLRVPPLLLSDWRQFLQDALQQAVPKHPEGDYHGVFRAFAARGGPDTSEPTPRDLKTFVNQIGALHREWQHEFPLSHLACYVLFHKDCKDVRKALLSDSDVELLSRIIGQEWRGIIAALHFGVPEEEARQLLLRGPMQSALTSGDGKTLAALESSHHAGFWSVLEDAVPAGAIDWNSLAPADLAKAATALADSRLFDNSDGQPEPVVLRSKVRTAATAVQAWIPFDAETVQGMVSIGHLVGDPEEMFPVLLSGVSRAPVGASEREGEVSPNVWMSSALTLIEGLVRLGSGEYLEQGIKVPLDAEQWVEVSNAVVEKDPNGRLLLYFELQDVEAVDELLAVRISNNQLDEYTFNAVYTAMATRSRIAMTTVASQVFSRLQSGESFLGDQIAQLVKALRLSNLAALIDEHDYTSLAEGGRYLHHLYIAVSENNAEAVAECMFAYLRIFPDGREPSHSGNSPNGYQNLMQILGTPNTVPGSVEHFTSLAKETQQLPLVFEMIAGNKPVPPFLEIVLHALLTSDDVPKPPDLVSENWAAIREVLRASDESSGSFEAFLKDLPGIDDLVAGTLSETFDVRDSSFYFALLRSSANTEFLNWCVAGLSSVEQSAWSEALASQGELLGLVKELNTHRVSMALGTTYFDALVNYAEQVADRSVSTVTDESWSELFNLLDTDRRQLFHRRAYGILKDSEGNASPEFFALFGDILFDKSILVADPRFIDEVCRPILIAGNEDGIAWMAEVAVADASLFANSSDPAAASDFRDRIQQRLDGAQVEDPTIANLRRIGAVLG